LFRTQFEITGSGFFIILIVPDRENGGFYISNRTLKPFGLFEIGKASLPK
jgi:hypothetical protein